jgi:NAD(P)-dependent dehydrogenase (short-subunit alcohol dehydrogenase family)
MNVVITGSTKGIGLGLSRDFLRRGHQVVVSSRHEEAVRAVEAQLGQVFERSRVRGVVCDVTDADAVQSLWDASVQAFGRVDLWINNAGREGEQKLFAEVDERDYVQTVATNLLGTMHGCRVAIAGMRAQAGDGTVGGKIFNMEGLGSEGRIQRRLSVYTTTKCAVRHFTRALVAECGDSPVQIGFLSPGMVVTDLLVKQAKSRPDWEQVRKIFNILADRVETVTPWLVDRMLESRRNGDAIRWLRGPKIAGRFLLAPFRKRDIV